MRKIFEKFVSVFLIILFVLGGLGLSLGLFVSVCLLYVLCLLIIIRPKLKDFRFPPTYGLYSLFLLFFFINFLWSENEGQSLIYFFLFLYGFFFWGLAYNLKDKLVNFKKLVITLGIVFGVITLIYLAFDNTLNINAFSLVHFAVAPLHHHHIGDFWVIVLIVIGSEYTKRKNMKWLIFLLFGFYFLFLSLSRSAYLALALGSLYFIAKSGKARSISIFKIYIVIAVVLFLYSSFQKSTLFAHIGYIGQSLIGFINNPFGVGVGNFEKISTDPRNVFLGLGSGSTSTHNIILEIMTGMGILGISFIVWLFKILKSIIKSEVDESLLYRTVFITLTVNFLFDYTYLIPTMLWIWFVSLGLVQNKPTSLLKRI
ncbi:hypothetical protein A2714_03220 [Candidatus Woesebacteria bacterium RIFCSPHIGHO2_01_FULL_38_9]|uniref:O-antigen ligase-related domain-containing protein n=1 Tax=Candidatus Woesebacteria bacterium RIFCSPHIGHO2_01_FULL_38_9 TaxID=1802492 RepID=A0A1F7Y1Y9_9BACT|nr:MAG: hypothetical protein A2714_03220 [Candidatus Woesebacteria bacterium RIFCSPHIGHO2_01_FULL_38_9]